MYALSTYPTAADCFVPYVMRCSMRQASPVKRVVDWDSRYGTYSVAWASARAIWLPCNARKVRAVAAGACGIRLQVR